MYRLHIDIPLGTDEEHAIYKSKLLVQELMGPRYATINEKYDVSEINYRLGHDEDRQKSNYMDKNENGHVSNKKTKIHISR